MPDIDLSKINLPPEMAQGMSGQLATLVAEQRLDQLQRLERSILRLERQNVQTLANLEKGIGSEGDLDLLLDQCDNILGRAFCALGDGATSPISSSIQYFRDEYLAHLTEGGCPFDPVASTVFAAEGATS